MTFRNVRLTTGICFIAASCGGERAPGVSDSKTTTPGVAASAPTQPPGDPRAAIFVEKGCPQCHSISALGVKSPAEIGPDLTLAYSDVQSRFNMKLDEFLKNPTGTMQIVLSSQIKLTPEERDSIIEILEDLHEDAEEAGETE